MAIRYGTSYFRSLDDAIRYYADYGYHRHDVLRKQADCEITIGHAPPLQPGERFEWNAEGRAIVIIE